MRPEVLEFIRVCEILAGKDIVLTDGEHEAVGRCVRDLEKKILIDRLQDDNLLGETLSKFPPIY